MQEQSLYNSKLINELFEKEDFKFISGAENEIESLKSKIDTQKLKRDFFINVINDLNGDMSAFEDASSVNKEELISRATNCMDSINNDIGNLDVLINELKDLNSSIVNLILEIEDSHDLNTNYNKYKFANVVGDIKTKISKYSEEVAKIYAQDVMVNQFINSLNNILIPNCRISINVPAKEKYEEAVVDRTEEISEEGIERNNVLFISEIKKIVVLPYTIGKLQAYYNKYSKEYKSYSDIIKREFTFPIEHFTKRPALARFREAYSLIRDKEAKSVFDALKCGIDTMFRYDLNAAIIAACECEDDLNQYLKCLDKKCLEKFKLFDIRYEIRPLKNSFKSNDIYDVVT